MQTRLTILCENSVLPQMGLIGEHGFSCYIETPQGNYLFDTGQGIGVLTNSRILDKSMKGLRGIALSHGHYDHTGGLPEVLHQSGPVGVYAHPDLFLKRFRASGKLRRYIGIPYHRLYLESLGAEFHLSKEWTQIGPGVHLTGEVPRRTDFEHPDRSMTAILPNGRQSHPDSLADDQSLVVDSDHGLIVLLGCGHAGLVNILRHVLEKTGRDRLYAILGGTHLGFAGDEQFERTLQALDEFRIEKVGVSHCTGFDRAVQLKNRLGDRFFSGSVGSVLEG